MRSNMEEKRNFWLLQIGGWAAYGIIVAIYTIPFASDEGMVAYRGALTVSCFLGTFVLRLACRREWNRGFRFPRSMINVLLWCVVLTWVCSALAIKAEYMWGADLHPFNLLLSLTTVTNVGFIFLSWAALYFGIKYYQTVEDERRRVLAAERHAREAELRALRYQIHPHFLFNTLNAISTLVTESENEIAVAMISRLADFFRATLEGPSADEVRLEDELALTEQYLEIEKLRLGDRLRVEVHVDPELLSHHVPHLVLQPLVENAIRHGIAPRAGRGTITVAAERDVEHLTITVTDDGLGERSRANTANGYRAGVGLNNINQRLADLYGDPSGLRLSWPAAGGCEATLKIPLNRSRPTGEDDRDI